MAQNKNQTQPTKIKVSAYIAALPKERQADVKALVKLMERVTGNKPVMWGPSIIGFDAYHYKYASGREGDMPIVAFSPRVGTLTLYIMAESARFKALMKKLGKYKVSGVCLHIKKLSDVDMTVLEKLIEESVKDNRRRLT